MKKIEARLWVCLGLAVAILLTLGFIFGNSLKSPEASSDQSNGVAYLLRPLLDPNRKMSDEQFSHLIRKGAHFTEFCLLGIEAALLSFFLQKTVTVGGVGLSAFFCLLAANIDEYIQVFTDRGSQVQDVLLDFCGASTGIALSLVVVSLVTLKIQKSKSKVKAEVENKNI